jgi:acyl-CoA hydrolase
MKSVHRFFSLLLVFLLLPACQAQKNVVIPAGATVLVLGDSVSYGTGAGRGEDYPTLLAAATGWQVVNAGIPGDTTAGGLQRLPELLEQHAPRLLLIELGGNDFLRHVPRNETLANLRAMLAKAKEMKIPAVLVAVPQPNLFGAALGSLSDDPVYETLSQQETAPLVSGVLAEVLSENAFKADPIHPNAEGYRQVAAKLAEALRDLGYLK